MKRIFYLLLIVGLITAATKFSEAQAVSVDGGFLASKFKFIDSQGTLQKDYSYTYGSTFSVGYRYVFENGILLQPRIGVRQAGASLVYDASNYQWNLQYSDIRVAAGYQYSLGRFSPYLTVSPYYSMLLSANQRLNNQNYDIKKSKAISKSDFGLYVTPGVKIHLSDALSTYFEFNYLNGFKNLEVNSNGQKSFNRACAFSFGLALSLKSASEDKK